MHVRRITIILGVLFCLSGPVLAVDSPMINLDPWGNIQSFWLATSSSEGTAQPELKFSSSELAPARSLYSFSREVSSYGIMAENTKVYLIYEEKPAADSSALLLIQSKDSGQTFSAPQVMTTAGKNPALASRAQQLAAAWEEEEMIYLVNSQDGGRFFGQPQTLRLTDEALSSPALTIDQNQFVHISFLAKNKNTGLKRVIYARLDPFSAGTEPASLEPRALFQSHDDLTNLQLRMINNDQRSLIVFWQNKYFARRESYYSISLDQGESFSPEQLFNFENELLSLGFVKDKFCALTFTDRLLVQEIALIPPAAPQPSGQLTYSLASSVPLLLSVELSTDNSFTESSTQSFSQLISQLTGEAVKVSLPDDLVDGRYWLRATVFDGLSSSAPGQPQSLTIDTVPPEMISLEADRRENNINFQGRLNEPLAWLSLNGSAVSLEADGSFAAQGQLTAGANLFTFFLSDEAGNVALVTEEVFYNPASPEMTVLTPQASDWFKPESTLIVETKVFDLQGDIEDESEAQVLLDGQALADSLSYDQAEGSLFGFISLPAELTNGRHTATIILSDTTGNRGQVSFSLNIDGSPPRITQQAGTKCFTDSTTVISLPLADQGAGLDLSGTLITLSGASFEGTISAEADELIITCADQLPEGTYEVEVLPRDLVGNTSEAAIFALVVDITAPKLTLSSIIEPQTTKDKLLIEGNIEEKYPASIKVSNHRTESKSFDLSGTHFSVEVKLAAGNNEIEIEVADQAGNTVSETVRTFAAAQASSKLIASFIHGPNPFSPVKDLPGAFSTHGKGMVFSYALAQPADVMIRIYDITGTLIWVKEVNNISSGATAWSGVDQFGQIAGNGIYPYFFSVSANGAQETRKGKIVIYQ